MNRSFAAIVLAAGEGSRMKSARPKILHEIAGRPMIGHVLAALAPLAPAVTVVVLGRGMAAVAEAVAPAKTVVQHPPRGTGDAVRAARPALETALAGIEDVLVLYGDTPLLQAEALARLLDGRRETQAAVAVAAMRPADPDPYGRLVLGADGGIERIVEARDASPQERAIGLCNGGIMAVAAAHLFDLVDRIGDNNAKREFYLTDIVAIARGRGLAVTHAGLPAEEVQGVNNRAELAAAEALMQHRLRRRAMEAGATLVAPETVFFSADTMLGRDVVIEPNVVFGPGVRIADDVRIRSFSHLDGATIDSGAVVGPYARLRPGAVLEAATSTSAISSRSRPPGSAPVPRPATSATSATAISAPRPISAPARSPAITTGSASTGRSSASARSSARTPRWSRRSRSATAPMSRPAASSRRMCRPTR